MTHTDEELTLRYEAWLRNGCNNTATAEELGINEASVRRSVRAATRRNLTGDFEGSKLPEGYVMGKVTSLVGPDGTRLEWQHKLPEVEALQATCDALIEAMRQELVPLDPVELVTQPVSDWLTFYPIVDCHFGQYSWHKEAGENYDLDIARSQYRDAVSGLMRFTPNSEHALIGILGDYYHADNNDAITQKSHNHLDVDGRHDKVLHLGAELAIWTIDMALQKHQHVTVHVCRGNHDPYASKALAMALWFRYENNPRVTIDRSPVELWSFQYGKNMISLTHGDLIKAEDMPGVMAAYEPVMWGNTQYRYGFSGHYHRTKKGPLSDEKHGAIWEILPAFTAKDAYNRSMGHASRRSMQAITFHPTEGRKYTSYANI